MMVYYWLEAEVAGGFGEGIDYRVDRTPRVSPPMRYEFQDWAGGHIVTTSATWIASRQLVGEFQRVGIAGLEFPGAVIVTRDPQWQELVPDALLPEWEWIVPVGAKGVDDFWPGDQGSLAISDRAATLLEEFGIGAGVLVPIPEMPDGPPRLDVGSILEEMRLRRERG